MSDVLNLNVRVSGQLKDFVKTEIRDGAYENISEYIRDLIRRDKLRHDESAFQSLKAELMQAFHTDPSEFKTITAADIKSLARTSRQR